MSAWAEEQGFKGVLLALGLYMALLLRLVQNAQRAKDRAGMFLVMGVAAALGFHVLVNVAMVIGAMPVTGIPAIRLFCSLLRFSILLSGSASDWTRTGSPTTN